MEERQNAKSVVAPKIERPSRQEVEAAVATLIRWAGDDPAREGLRDTPRRVTDAYLELFRGNFQCAEKELDSVFPKEAGYSEFVLVRDIQFYSHCEHHLMPFFGKAHIAYIPSDYIVGLSRIPQLVQTCARRLQTQERLTAETGAAIHNALNAKGVAVLMEAEHLCMSMRGLNQPASQAVTVHFTGVFVNDARRQSEFMSLARRSS